jgi:hypothetical protein
VTGSGEVMEIWNAGDFSDGRVAEEEVASRIWGSAGAGA